MCVLVVNVWCSVNIIGMVMMVKDATCSLYVDGVMVTDGGVW